MTDSPLTKRKKSTLLPEEIEKINYAILNNIKKCAFDTKKIKNISEISIAVNRSEGYISKKGNDKTAVFNLGLLIEISNYLECDVRDLLVNVRDIFNERI